MRESAPHTSVLEFPLLNTHDEHLVILKIVVILNTTGRPPWQLANDSPQLRERDWVST